jgi:CsoR family transcriptional regulator, copper-sensing transcriptional repressor
MFRPKDTQERILHRIKIIQGHLQKVRTMVEQDEYCIDIVHHSQAVQSALHKLDALVMENHLQTCVADAIKKGDSQSAIGEIMAVFNKKNI